MEQALQWVVANAAAYHIASVNMSLGDDGNYQPPDALRHRRRAGGPGRPGGDRRVVVGKQLLLAGERRGGRLPVGRPELALVGAVDDASAGGFSYTAARSPTPPAPIAWRPSRSADPDLTTIFAPGAPITGGQLAAPSPITAPARPHRTSPASPFSPRIWPKRTSAAGLRLGNLPTLLKDTGITIHDGDDEDDNVVNTGLDFTRVDVVALAEAIWLMQAPAGSHLVELADGQIVTGIDFGNQILPGQVAGTVWNDVDGDGIRGAAETGLEGIYVYADLNSSSAADSGEPYSITAADGSYRLGELAPGSYTIRRTLPYGWANTYPASAGHTVTVVTQQTTAGIDFGNRDITGQVRRARAWTDTDGDGQRDPRGTGTRLPGRLCRSRHGRPARCRRTEYPHRDRRRLRAPAVAAAGPHHRRGRSRGVATDGARHGCLPGYRRQPAGSGRDRFRRLVPCRLKFAAPSGGMPTATASEISARAAWRG